jgi:hypothetical protein
MKLYLLRRRDWKGYDIYLSFLVRAATEIQARQMIADTIWPLGDVDLLDYQNRECNVWLDPFNSTCEQVVEAGMPAVIMSSYRHG